MKERKKKEEKEGARRQEEKENREEIFSQILKVANKKCIGDKATMLLENNQTGKILHRHKKI